MTKISIYDFLYMLWCKNIPNVFSNQTFIKGLYENIKDDPTQGFNKLLLKNRLS